MKIDKTAKAGKLSLSKTTVKNLTAVRTGIQTGVAKPEGCIPNGLGTCGYKSCFGTRM